MLALISDLHANLPALRAVLARADELGISDLRCLGDVVGYGAEPEACIDLVLARCKWSLRGNHDWGLLTERFDEFNPLARESLVWSRKRLKPRPWTPLRRRRWNWLLATPERVDEDGFHFVHASPRDPIKEYVHRSDGFLDPEKMQVLFSLIDGPCFVGHTHWPGITTPDFRFTQATEDEREGELPEGKSIVNVGSVGQPRDGDPRACFLVVDGRHYRYERVEYPIDEAQRAIRATGLSPYLADRLERGR